MSHNDRLWSEHYKNNPNASSSYPEAFVNRLLRSKFPVPGLDNISYQGLRILDLSCGYGRNFGLLRDLGFDLHATEVTDDLVASLSKQHPELDIRQGKAHDLPFEDSYFNGVVACNSCYYLEEGVRFSDNLAEIHRILSPGGWFLGSIISSEHSAMEGAIAQKDGSSLICNDSLGLRNNYRFQGASSELEVEDLLMTYFTRCKIGNLQDSFMGFKRYLFYFTCYRNG